MSDLISRQKVIDIIHKEIERTATFSEHETQINIEMAVKELPTAYNIGKVVEELDGAMWLTTNDDGETNNLSIQVVSFDDAIEIVKQGGVSDDVCEWTKYDYKTIRSPHERDWSIPSMKDFKYCPYCGKKIKVVE